MAWMTGARPWDDDWGDVVGAFNGGLDDDDD
jgi:hypothetical protein